MADESQEKPKEQPAPQPAPAPAPGSAAVLLVERWWQDWFPNSPVSRDSAAWNHAYQAKENLKDRLKKQGSGVRD
ncbi:MAG: hypothetical protein ABSA09_02695 [Desulfobaccales bacterium]|jgi:hypothetical protein